MESVFLSYSFRETPRAFRSAISSVLDDHEIRPVIGEVLEGRELTPAIRLLIEEADAFVSVWTPESPSLRPTPWVYRELRFARELKKPNIALKHLQAKEPPGKHEYIEWDDQNPAPALLRLHSTLARWKRSIGRRAKVRLLPATLEPLIKSGKAMYRLSDESGRIVGDWMPAVLRSEIGGFFAHVSGVWTDAYIEVMIEAGGRHWGSRATPQWLHVELTEGSLP
jgi:hypothetical protein